VPHVIHCFHWLSGDSNVPDFQQLLISAFVTEIASDPEREVWGLYDGRMFPKFFTSKARLQSQVLSSPHWPVREAWAMAYEVLRQFR